VKSIRPPYLRLHVEPESELSDPVAEIVGVAELMAGFAAATGWTLAFRETPESVAARRDAKGLAPPPPRGVLAIDDLSADWPAGKPAAHRQRCDEMLAGINRLLEQLTLVRETLWRREAELATGVPVVAHASESQHLAGRLEASLRAACDGVGARAAALYVLDDATRHLKLRSCWGLPADRLLAPPRQLQGALADLEALLGHAIVLEDTSLTPQWEAPESASAAVCVPVSSATTPLGTLWVFDDHARDFSSQETNLVEIVAGRIAAELEREAAVARGARSGNLEREVEQAASWQQSRLLKIPPMIDEFDVAGWTRSAGPIGGDFHHWSVLSDGRLALGVGDVQAPMIESGLGAATLATLVETHAEYLPSAGQLLTRVGESLWTGGAGDLFASLAYATIDVVPRKLQIAGAGSVGAILFGERSIEPLIDELPPLGGDPGTFYHQRERTLAVGDWLLMMSEGVRMRLAETGVAFDDLELVRRVRREQLRSADSIVERLIEWMAIDRDPSPRYDMSLLVVGSR